MTRRIGQAGAHAVGILFGRERLRLRNEEGPRLRDRSVVTLSGQSRALSLAQSGAAAPMLLVGYEWFKLGTSGALPFAMPERSEPRLAHQSRPSFDNLVRELDKVEFCARPRSARPCCQSAQHLHPDGADQAGHAPPCTAWMAIAEGRKGPAKVACSMASRPPACVRFWRNTGRRVAVRKAARCAGSRGYCAKSNGLRTHPVAGANHRSPLCRAIQAPDAGRPSHSRLRLVRGRVAIELVNPRRSDVIVSDRATRKALAGGTGIPVVHAVADVERDLATELDRLRRRF